MKPLKFNNSTYSTRKLVSNILRVYSSTQQHHRYDWYKEANLYAHNLAKISGLSVVQCCGILAAFSPLKTWRENKRIAAAFIVHKDTAGLHTNLFRGKAVDITAYRTAHGNEVDYILQVLKGPKIKSFFLNIVNPSCAANVTIDRHAICIAVGRKLQDSKLKVSKHQYEHIKYAYIQAAKSIGISPVLLQSSTWLLWRENGQLKLQLN